MPPRGHTKYHIEGYQIFGHTCASRMAGSGQGDISRPTVELQFYVARGLSLLPMSVRVTGCTVFWTRLPPDNDDKRPMAAPRQKRPTIFVYRGKRVFRHHRDALLKTSKFA